jgi:hypothetical protein
MEVPLGVHMVDNAKLFCQKRASVFQGSVNRVVGL